MKPFLAIDLTADKSNEIINGEELLVAKTSDTLSEALESSSEDACQTLEQTMLPLIVRIFHWLCGVIGVIIPIGILKAMTGEDSVTLREAYQNASWMFWLAGACLLMWLILTVISHKKQKETLEDDESTQVFEKLNGTCDAIFCELAVPSVAEDVDILSFYYKIKNDKIKVCEKGLQAAPYSNYEFKIFTDSDNLYIANLDGKYALPISSLTKITTVKKLIHLSDWNKEESFNKGRFKQYRLSESNMNTIICKTYHILEFNYGGELWGIYFPCYELPVFERLTGITATEE